jgi:hypothetical protein
MDLNISIRYVDLRSEGGQAGGYSAGYEGRWGGRGKCCNDSGKTFVSCWVICVCVVYWGCQVRLSPGYRKVGDARKGPLRQWRTGAGPGEIGEVVDVQDRLVQVWPAELG